MRDGLVTCSHFNSSAREGCLPQTWKSAEVVRSTHALLSKTITVKFLFYSLCQKSHVRVHSDLLNHSVTIMANYVDCRQRHATQIVQNKRNNSQSHWSNVNPFHRNSSRSNPTRHIHLNYLVSILTLVYSGRSTLIPLYPRQASTYTFSNNWEEQASHHNNYPIFTRATLC